MRDSNLPGSFVFKLSIAEAADAVAVLFLEVSGMPTKSQAETVTEGGDNRLRTALPKPIKHANLVFKRGVVSKKSALAKWCMDTLGGDGKGKIKAQTLIVTLEDSKGNTVKSWQVNQAFPVKLTFSDVASTKSEMAIDSLAFSYKGLESL